MHNVALFIDSFDGNSDVWKAFFSVYEKYWGDCCFQRYLISNEKEYKTNNLTVIKTGKEKNWFVMTIEGLEHIPEKYVFFVLEDQLIGKRIDNEVISEIVSRMEREKIFYYRMTCSNRFEKDSSFIQIPENTPYPISLQPAIWEREYLLQLLKELYADGNKTPWDFERHFIEKYRGGSSKNYIQGVRYDSRNIMNYKNILIQGKWDPRVIRFYKRQGIIINTGERPFMAINEVLLDGLKRNKLFRSLSITKQAYIKKTLKKIGIKFMT